MPRFILLSGAAGSGKTTFRQNLRNTIPDLQEISGDDYIEEMAAKDGLSYQDAWQAYNKATPEVLRERLAKALANPTDIVWDATNLTPQVRRTVLESVPDNYTLVAISVEAPLGLSLERVWERKSDTGKDVPEDVVRTQHAGYQRPHFDEGFDHVMVVHEPEGRVELIT